MKSPQNRYLVSVLDFFSRYQGLIMVALFSSALLSLRYLPILQSLKEQKVMDSRHDGFKTYMNAVYHAHFDENCTDFKGMNYPYTEHIVAATELPGLAILLHWLSPYFPSLPDYIFGITHLILLSCIWLCAILLFLIFKQLKMPDWFAIIVAIGLTFLAPQNLRFGPHLGLAPPCVIPAILYGLILLEKLPRISVSIYLSLVLFLSAMLHFYFFAIGVIAIGLYFFFSFIRRLDFRWLFVNIPYYVGAIVPPTAFFLFWMILKDPIADRPAKPLGFLLYRSKWEGIFLFPKIPLWDWVDKNIIKIENVEFEGWAYVGLVAGIFTLASLVAWFLSRCRQPLLPYIGEFNKKFAYPMLGMGVVIALLSCGVPFNIGGLSFLLDYAGPLRQFRSIGRFAWVFYYVLNIIAFTSIYNSFSKLNRPVIRFIAFALVLGLLTYEAWVFSYTKYMFSQLKEVENLQPGKKFTDIPQVDYADYQAILPIPYINIGNNNFAVAGNGNIIQYAMVMSAQTGLPITGAMLTRTSTSQTFKQMQLVAKPFQHPIILDEYPNNKPLLLLVSKDISKDDSLLYSHLMQNQKILYESKLWRLYKLKIESFDSNIRQRKQSLLNKTNQSQLYNSGNFSTTDSTSNFIFEPFDDSISETKFQGEGAFQVPVGKPESVIFQGKMPSAVPRLPCEALVWVTGIEDRATLAQIKLEELRANGALLHSETRMVGTNFVEMSGNGWLLVRIPFVLEGTDSNLRLSVLTQSAEHCHLVIDEVLIKPEQLDIYKKVNESIWWNNRLFE